MTNPSKNRGEQPSTYFVQDRSNEHELKRVEVQGRMITASMGGVLPEQDDSGSFQRVLDVGCGAGDWLIELAQAYPNTSMLVGVDISQRMVDYGQAQAQEQQLNARIEFRVMDALRKLEFPDGTFDLTNERFGTSYMRTWDWPELLSEMRRVTRAGGVVRITEPDALVQSSSSALTQYYELFMKAMHESGHLYTPEKDGLKRHLASILQRSGMRNVQTRSYTLEYRAGTPEGQHFYQDVAYGLRTLVPFLRKWTQVPDNYEKMCRQALDDIQQPDFVATWPILTAWGTV